MIFDRCYSAILPGLPFTRKKTDDPVNGGLAPIVALSEDAAGNTQTALTKGASQTHANAQPKAPAVNHGRPTGSPAHDPHPPKATGVKDRGRKVRGG